MGRFAYSVVLAWALFFGVAESGFSQGQPQPPQGGHGRISRPTRSGVERWQAMRPDERQKFRNNAERWLRMPPEQQRMLREREQMRRQRSQRDADAALHQSGLQLEAERREQYERRYMQERQRIEQSLRQELEERRQRELAPVVERLKKEFTQGNAPAASQSGTANGTPSPSKR